MDKLSLSEIVNKKFIKFSIILFIFFITISAAAFYVFHFFIYEREVEDVENDINHYFTDLNNIINYLEESYHLTAEKQLKSIYNIYQSNPNPNLNEIHNELKKDFFCKRSGRSLPGCCTLLYNKSKWCNY